jgi:ubiquinone/menaquinone biosynthesis C-methylase UbiE
MTMGHHGDVVDRWTLDERAHSGQEHLERDYVAGYDRKSGTDPVDDVAVLRHHGLDHTSTVVDLGAGTGMFALAVAPHCRRVIAVDVSAAMLEFLHARIREAALDNVELVEAGFLSYEHAGAPADVVYTRNALHHLPDFWKAIALRRVAEMLRAGGILRLRDLIYDFQPAEAGDVIGRWLDGAVTDPTVGYTREDLAEHVRTEFSTFRWLLEPMIDAAGFDIAEADFDRSVYGRYTCIKR